MQHTCGKKLKFTILIFGANQNIEITSGLFDQKISPSEDYIIVIGTMNLCTDNGHAHQKKNKRSPL